MTATPAITQGLGLRRVALKGVGLSDTLRRTPRNAAAFRNRYRVQKAKRRPFRNGKAAALATHEAGRVRYLELVAHAELDLPQ